MSIDAPDGLGMLPDTCFYRDLGDGRFASTGATAGPWGPKSQHAGPPSALLGRAMQRYGDRAGLRIARITVEVLRPVPVADLEVAVRSLRPGSRTELLEGEITCGGKAVMRATAWRMVASPADTPVLRPEPAPPGLPGPAPRPKMAGAYLDGYLTAMEWRLTSGAGFDAFGPGAAWARQRVPLVAGEEDTPLTRALTLADSNWAVGMELDYRAKLVINTDVTLALHRDPVGEWLCLRSATAASPHGSGLAVGQLHDADGDCGRVLQTLLVTEREAAPAG
jgi:hypothetical protein